jgi:hypothetical protein
MESEFLYKQSEDWWQGNVSSEPPRTNGGDDEAFSPLTAELP